MLAERGGIGSTWMNESALSGVGVRGGAEDRGRGVEVLGLDCERGATA